MWDAAQDKFFDFIIERTQDDKKAEMQAQLEDSFKKQQEGGFDALAFAASAAAIISMLKPEFVDEVKDIIANFGKDKA